MEALKWTSQDFFATDPVMEVVRELDRVTDEIDKPRAAAAE